VVGQGQDAEGTDGQECVLNRFFHVRLKANCCCRVRIEQLAYPAGTETPQIFSILIVPTAKATRFQIIHKRSGNQVADEAAVSGFQASAEVGVRHEDCFCVVSDWPGYYLHPQRNEALPKKKEIKMNTKVLLLGAVVTAFTFTSFAASLALSPHAQANQIKVVSSVETTPTVTIAYVTPATPALLSPHAQANQVRVVKGVVAERNPYLDCRNAMTGSSPKAIAACSETTAMSGCATVAMQK
jgi:hypothetical protein